MKNLSIAFAFIVLLAGTAAAQPQPKPAPVTITDVKQLQQMLDSANQRNVNLAAQVQRLHNELDSARCGYGVLKK